MLPRFCSHFHPSSQTVHGVCTLVLAAALASFTVSCACLHGKYRAGTVQCRYSDAATTHYDKATIPLQIGGVSDAGPPVQWLLHHMHLPGEKAG